MACAGLEPQATLEQSELSSLLGADTRVGGKVESHPVRTSRIGQIVGCRGGQKKVVAT